MSSFNARIAEAPHRLMPGKRRRAPRRLSPPTTDVSKSFTVISVTAGVGFILAFLDFIVSRTLKDRIDRKGKGS